MVTIVFGHLTDRRGNTRPVNDVLNEAGQEYNMGDRYMLEVYDTSKITRQA